MPVQFRNFSWFLVLGFSCVWGMPVFSQEAMSEADTTHLNVSSGSYSYAAQHVGLTGRLGSNTATWTDRDGVEFKSEVFEAPEMIMVGRQPLNVEAKQMYPSPVMMDLDNDNRIELVVGDIFGSLNIYENQNESATGDPVWSKHVRLESTDGQPIKVSNW